MGGGGGGGVCGGGICGDGIIGGGGIIGGDGDGGGPWVSLSFITGRCPHNTAPAASSCTVCCLFLPCTSTIKQKIVRFGWWWDGMRKKN